VAPREQRRLVVGLVTGSHFLNHAFLLVLAPFVVTLASAFDVSVAAIGLAIGVQQAVVVVLQLPFGHLSDTRSRRLVLAISLFVGTLGTGLTALAASYEWLLVAQAILGVGIAGHHPAHYPLLAAVSGAGSRGRAYSAHAFGGEIGLAAPFAVAAAVTALGGGWRHAVGTVAVLGGLVALGTLALARDIDDAVALPDADQSGGDESRDPSIRDRSLTARWTAAARELLSAPGIVALTVLAFLTSAAAWCIRTYTPQLLTATYGLPDTTANVLTSAMLGTGALLIVSGGLLTDRLGAGRVMVAGYLGLAVLAAALATGRLALVVLLAVLPFSGTISLSRPARSTLADRLSARRDLGKNFALITVGISLGGAVAPPAFGWLIDAAGVASAFGVVAALGLGCLGLSVWIARAEAGGRSRVPSGTD
jgi:predicted MFS family arabinose efflux permease